MADILAWESSANDICVGEVVASGMADILNLGNVRVVVVQHLQRRCIVLDLCHAGHSRLLEAQIESGNASAEHIENVLNRLRAAPPTPSVETALALRETPVADPHRYDRLRREVIHAL